VVDDRKVVGGAKAEAIGADRSATSANFMLLLLSKYLSIMFSLQL
jgi:hypothetical protein